MNKRWVLAAALALVPMLCGPGAVRAQSAGGPRMGDVPQGRLEQLVWLIGDFDCRIEQSRSKTIGLHLRRRFALGPGGHELYMLETGPGLITRGKIGYNPRSHAWYESDLAGRQEDRDAQTLFGRDAALQAHSFTLTGLLPGPNRTAYALRISYRWRDHDAFTFSAELYRKDGVWTTFEKHSCVRV